MKVRAVVVFDVEGAKTCQDAYDQVFGFKGANVHAWRGKRYTEAYIHDVIEVESSDDTRAAREDGP